LPVRDVEAQPAAATGATPRTATSGSWFVRLGGFVCLAIVAVAIPVGLAARYGALDIPRSDDWSYLLTLFRWVDGGELGFNHWAAPPLIAQLALAAPVALVSPDSIAAVHVLSAFAGLAALCATVAFGRRYVTGPAAWFVAIVVGGGPLFMALSATFMTDHWAFAAQMCALALAARAFAAPPFSVPVWGASVAVAFVAVAIRQYSIIPAAVILAAGVVEAHRSGVPSYRRAARHGVAVFVIAVGVLGVWWLGRPGVADLAPRAPTAESMTAAFRGLLGYLRLLGLLLLPVVLWSRPVEIVRNAVRASPGITATVAAVSGLALVLQFSETPASPFVGNYVARSGVLAQDVLSGSRPDVLPGAFFDALAWLGMAGAVVLLVALVPSALRLADAVRAGARWPRSPLDALLLCNLLAFAVFVAAEGVVGLPLFDRYALPVLPLAAFALMRASQNAPAPVSAGDRLRLAGIAATLGLIAFVGVAFTAESASFDATRWKVAERATRAGFTPRQIDGGFEWVAWHQQVGPPYWPLVPVADKRRLREEFNRPFCVRVQIGAGEHARSVTEARSTAPTRPPARIAAVRIAGTCGA
jgi:hypothetical protein